MTTLEKWQFAQTNMDESLMNESLHENFKFINHSQGKEFSKKDLKPFVKGKIYQGFASGVKMFVRRRGGKV